MSLVSFLNSVVFNGFELPSADLHLKSFIKKINNRIFKARKGLQSRVHNPSKKNKKRYIGFLSLQLVGKCDCLIVYTIVGDVQISGMERVFRSEVLAVF